MRVSVVIRSKDEADRLRLTLHSLSCQTTPAEIVVVNDGSSDHTREVIEEAAKSAPLAVAHHRAPRGRSAAANAGVEIASGDIVLFLDGDTLAAPDLVARHASVHAEDAEIVGRGETHHLRGTRFFLDPEKGTPKPGEEARVARLSPAEMTRMCVTRAEIRENFAAIDLRSQAGVYPGAGARALYELEMDALRHHPNCAVLWAAASGSNMSVRRASFLREGGFNAGVDINEHRELALRLTQAGARMTAVDGARTYHLTHRAGWRDPLKDTGWEDVFYQAHPIPDVKLLAVLWASLSDAAGLPAKYRIFSLPELEKAARRDSGFDCDAARSHIPGFTGSNASPT
ncbi:glycosyltransferase family 2 protein [Methylocapsa palsarum]|uniref:Glycosyl transferase family 2 n=1 Tax=Methylocapsa palsarum TaxID=1612308 RepID=A0A1I3YU27_9HYPH|nr:glycosyltransferase family 2 protein [Methylocapsa palsarum]SFK35313.1 Glycosyl transferase family 2 [Methylocapsa palsarum]